MPPPSKIARKEGKGRSKVDVMTGELTSTSLRPPSLHTATKKELADYFENSYSLNEWLFTSLKDDSSFYLCPDRLRLPLIFYYCHTAVVYVNKLLLAGLIQNRINPTFESLFETGVDEMSWDDTENYRMGGNFEWPSMEEVVEYRRTVRKKVLDVIERGDLELPVTEESAWWAVWMGMEHERIHIETSSVLIRQLPVHLVHKPKGWRYAPLVHGEPVVENPMLKQAGRQVIVTKSRDAPCWGWDNEYGTLADKIPEFEASKYKVTNREMLAFVRNDGYHKRELWSEEGWRWKSYRQVRHPPFWVCQRSCKSNCGAALADYSHCKPWRKHQEATEDADTQEEFRLRLMFDVVPMPLDWPVEVNYHEAKAYCRWRGDGFRLLTELEHNACRGLPSFESVEDDPIYDEKSTRSYNHNLAFGSSTPVNLYPASPVTGLHDTMGNVWDWCEDHFNGLPGFATHKFYDDFSSNTFDARHRMILGGSWVATGDEASRFARFAFRSHFIQHAGFRLARTVDPANHKTPVRIIDSRPFTINTTATASQREEDEKDPALMVPGVEERVVASSNLVYAEDTRERVEELIREEHEGLASVEREIGQIVRNHVAQVGRSRTLIVGCRSGKIAFDLSTICDRVVGVDVSARALQVANSLKSKRAVSFDWGKLTAPPSHQKTEHIEFHQLTWLPCELSGFDIVINMISDRVSSAQAWLLRTRELIAEQQGEGVGIVVSREWSGDRLRREVFGGKGAGAGLTLVASHKIALEDDASKHLYVTTWK